MVLSLLSVLLILLELFLISLSLVVFDSLFLFLLDWSDGDCVFVDLSLVVLESGCLGLLFFLLTRLFFILDTSMMALMMTSAEIFATKGAQEIKQ